MSNRTAFRVYSLDTLIIPLVVGSCFLGLWEFLVHINDVPEFVLPSPTRIGASLLEDGPSLLGSLGVTLKITLAAFFLALVGGVGLAVLFSQSRTLEMALFPYAVILQVTPVVAIAPLVLIWVGFDRAQLALLILAWIIAFFPILSNTVLGLRSADHNLRDLFQLYHASRWQTLRHLLLPAALPHILSGMKVSGGLALIGAIVAEFVAGSGTSSGLAWRIIEAGNRLQIPKMFAALVLLSLTGIVIFFALSMLERVLLRRWHESAVIREG